MAITPTPVYGCETVKKIVSDAYALITTQSPTTGLHGDDMSRGVRYLNLLLQSYSSDALLITAAREITAPLQPYTQFVNFVMPGFPIPTPIPNTPLVTWLSCGRLANLENVWIELSGVTYPLFDQSRNEFFESYKFEPLAGLPLYAIVRYLWNMTTIQLYPKPSQFYQFFVWGKFQLAYADENSMLENIPDYMVLFLIYALGRHLRLFKARNLAWTKDHEQVYQELLIQMQAVSTMNLNIRSDDENMLWGAWRVRSGV